MQLNPEEEEEFYPGAVGWVIFAVKEEARPFTRRRALIASGRSRQTSRVLTTGMGARNAERVFLASLDDGSDSPDWVLTCGFAGGLKPQLPAGAVGFEADPAFPLTQRLLDAGAQPWKFHCAEAVSITVAEKSELRRLTQADAVEMESGVIRQLARQRGIPSATVRVISDAADEPLPLDFNSLMTPQMTLSVGRLVGRLLGSPRKIPELIRFGRQTQRAASSLAEVLVATLG